MRVLMLIHLSLLLFSFKAIPASSVGKCKQVVIENLMVQKISDLDFGTAPQNSPAKKIEPGSAEDNENASFRIQGEKNKNIQVILPLDNTVLLNLITELPNIKIPVKTFIAVNQFKTNIDSGVLDSKGQLLFFVGATRDPITSNQVTGYYDGSFTVNVVY